jgi:hypothetical protein
MQAKHTPGAARLLPLLTAALAAALLIQPAVAQDKPPARSATKAAPKSKANLMTRDELRACMNEQDRLQAIRAGIDREQATLDQQKATVERVSKEIGALADLVEANEAKGRMGQVRVRVIMGYSRGTLGGCVSMLVPAEHMRDSGGREPHLFVISPARPSSARRAPRSPTRSAASSKSCSPIYRCVSTPIHGSDARECLLRAPCSSRRSSRTVRSSATSMASTGARAHLRARVGACVCMKGCTGVGACVG